MRHILYDQMKSLSRWRQACKALAFGRANSQANTVRLTLPGIHSLLRHIPVYTSLLIMSGGIHLTTGMYSACALLYSERCKGHLQFGIGIRPMRAEPLLYQVVEVHAGHQR